MKFCAWSFCSTVYVSSTHLFHQRGGFSAFARAICSKFFKYKLHRMGHRGLGETGEPIAAPWTWRQNRPLCKKYVQFKHFSNRMSCYWDFHLLLISCWWYPLPCWPEHLWTGPTRRSFLIPYPGPRSGSSHTLQTPSSSLHDVQFISLVVTECPPNILYWHM